MESLTQIAPTNAWKLNRQFAQVLVQAFGLAQRPPLKVPQGRILIGNNEAVDIAYVLVEGELSVHYYRNDPTAAHLIPVVFAQGDVALLSLVFTQQVLRGELVASTPCCVHAVRRMAMLSFLDEHPQHLKLLTLFFANRLQDARERELQWVERSVRSRLVLTLTRMCTESQAQHDAGGVRIVCTHEQLAMRSGLSRPKVSVELKRLEHDAVLRNHRGHIDILDLAALQDLA